MRHVLTAQWKCRIAERAPPLYDLIFNSSFPQVADGGFGPKVRCRIAASHLALYDISNGAKTPGGDVSRKRFVFADDGTGRREA